ncbi:Gfo/Idh/MocA family protein [Bauldia sp.]|uniref:Gfo/Idh/MocA family protein n=1 Tax=Bauldia sp. TaxID=2575872 RepID=UPI003BAD50B7
MTEPSSPLRAAIVGVGQASGKGSPTAGAFRIGYVHARMYERTAGIDLVAAADINQANLDAFVETFRVANAYPDLGSMLKDARPDIVSICTYVGLHFEMIEACAAAGVRGIICEKPFVESPAQLTALRDLVARTGVKIVVPHFRRYLGAFARAEEVYNSGEIGQPLVVTAAIGDEWDLSEWGSHWLDMFRFFHRDAMPEWVLGQARVTTRRGFGHAMEDHAAVMMAFPGGGRAVLETGVNYLNDGVTMVLSASRGSIVVIREDQLRIYSAEGERSESFEDPEGGLKAWSRMAAELRDWINDGTVPRLGFDHVAGTAELNLGCYLSMVDGDRIDFPLAHATQEWPVEALARRRMASKG